MVQHCAKLWSWLGRADRLTSLAGASSLTANGSLCRPLDGYFSHAELVEKRVERFEGEIAADRI